MTKYASYNLHMINIFAFGFDNPENSNNFPDIGPFELRCGSASHVGEFVRSVVFFVDLRRCEVLRKLSHAWAQ